MEQNSRKTVERIMGTYKRAWEDHDPSLLPTIFSENALYQEKPERVLNGIKEIEWYWSELSRTQRNVVFEIKDINDCSGTAVVEWSARFERIDVEELWTLDGVMLLELKQDKIDKLKEYFFASRSAI